MTNVTIKKVGEWDCDTYLSEAYAMHIDAREIGGAEILTSETGAYVERIDIDSENDRGKGYGTALLQELSSIYGSITIAPDNEGAQRLYDRLGTDVSTRGDNWAIDQGFGVYEI